MNERIQEFVPNVEPKPSHREANRVRRLSSKTRAPSRRVMAAFGQRSHAAR
jgi:hypothetical protein